MWKITMKKLVWAYTINYSRIRHYFLFLNSREWVTPYRIWTEKLHLCNTYLDSIK